MDFGINHSLRKQIKSSGKKNVITLHNVKSVTISSSCALQWPAQFCRHCFRPVKYLSWTFSPVSPRVNRIWPSPTLCVSHHVVLVWECPSTLEVMPGTSLRLFIVICHLYRCPLNDHHTIYQRLQPGGNYHRDLSTEFMIVYQLS
jgi:hypothetical protein